MTGEMYSIHPITAREPDGTVWPLHAAIVRGLRRRGYVATVQPFDQYQGPYILIGTDIRVGDRPYQLAVQGLGIVRLWLGLGGNDMSLVYREDTDSRSHPFWPDGQGAGRRAIKAALEVIGG